MNTTDTMPTIPGHSTTLTEDVSTVRTIVDRVYDAVGETRGFPVPPYNRASHSTVDGRLTFRFDFGGAAKRNASDAYASAEDALQPYVTAIRSAGIDASGIDRPQHDSSGWYILIFVAE